MRNLFAPLVTDIIHRSQSTVPVAVGRFPKPLRQRFCIPALDQIFSDFLSRLRKSEKMLGLTGILTGNCSGRCRRTGSGVEGRLGLAMRRTSPRRFAPLATLCAATVASFVAASVLKLGDTEQSFSEIVGAGERGEELSGVRPWRLPASEEEDAEWVYVLQLGPLPLPACAPLLPPCGR